MAAYKPWRDKGYLHDAYVKKGKTLKQIVEDCKAMGYSVTEMTIFNNLKSFNLLTNSRNLGPRSVGGKSGSKRGFYG